MNPARLPPRALEAAGAPLLRPVRERPRRGLSYRELLERVPAVVYVAGRNGVSSTIYMSPQIEELTGYAPSAWEADAELWAKLLHPEDRERVLTEAKRTNESGELFDCEYRLLTRRGRTVWLRDRAQLVRGNDGTLWWQGVLIDIAERKHAEDKVAFLAYHDQLTGLPNRTMFEEILELDLARARRHDLSVAVVSVDLDDFKLVNETLGYDAGDQLLGEVAARLTHVSRETDVVARLGGDQFLLLLSDLERGSSLRSAPEEEGTTLTAEVVAARIQESMRRPFRLGDVELYATASLGISLYPVDAHDARTLIQNAEAAMYRSRKAGPGGYVIYPSGDRRTGARLKMGTLLHRAVERREWVLHYQPIVNLADGRTVGVEALVRWDDPARGILPPSEFIALAEEMGLIEPIGEWVLRELASQSVRWREQGLDLEVSFNLSPRQFWDPGLASKVIEPLRSAGCPLESVVVEITETAAMTDPARTQEILLGLREEGLRFAIDDFGTGYSSLSRLRDLPVDTLKIDRSFVAPLPGDPQAGALVTSIIQLANGLGMVPLAEGIESEDQRRFLTAQGCVQGQGYLFSHPVPAEEIPARLR
ncbi:MAG: EAL domain-containing protein [Actinobacteria bacterium]|nr:EAL domain-containing protein [Actinomycetota bacterium]